MNEELNCCGMPCPEPVLATRNMIANKEQKNITVLVDNFAASENVRRFLEKNGFSAVVTPQNDHLWTITAVRACTEGCEITESLPPAEMHHVEESGKTLVFITTPTLGRGDDVLGTKLMENFLATLPELGEKLWRIVLVNGAVKLVAQEGKALTAIQKLHDAGVSVFVCGTCLEFYGLMEQKRVGETTNMLDIVTSLDLADKVIRP